MKHHRHQPRCYELITKTTRLRMSIDTLEAREDADAPEIRLEAARQWAGFHRANVELLALTPPADRDAARRQQATARGHEAEQRRWLAVVAELEEQVAGSPAA